MSETTKPNEALARFLGMPTGGGFTVTGSRAADPVRPYEQYRARANARADRINARSAVANAGFTASPWRRTLAGQNDNDQTQAYTGRMSSLLGGMGGYG